MATAQKHTRQELFELVERAINKTLAASSKQTVSLSWDMKPLLAIGDLDSQMGVEVTLELELALDPELNFGTNILIDPSGVRPKARTVRETVTAILSIIGRSS